MSGIFSRNELNQIVFVSLLDTLCGKAARCGRRAKQEWTGELPGMPGRMIAAARIAEAMGQQIHEFKLHLPHLMTLGFPLPADPNQDLWHTDELLDWVTKQQELNIRLLQYLLAEG
jgi:hypothetical protein